MASTYIIRNPPPDLWRRFKSTAAQKETPMRTVILRMIERYVEANGDCEDRADLDKAIRKAYRAADKRGGKVPLSVIHTSRYDLGRRTGRRAEQGRGGRRDRQGVN